MSAPLAGASRLLLATNEGIQPIIRAALELQSASPSATLLVLIGADAAFPFKPRPSTILVPGMPDGVIACVPQLDEFGVASRLASTLGLPGCYEGTVVELAELWLNSLEPVARQGMYVSVACADTVTAAAEDLGRRVNVPVGTLKN